MKANVDFKLPPLVFILSAAIVAAVAMPALITWSGSSLALAFAGGIVATVAVLYLMALLVQQALRGDWSEVAVSVTLVVTAVVTMVIGLLTTAVAVVLIAKAVAWVAPSLDFVDAKVLAGVMIAIVGIRALTDK